MSSTKSRMKCWASMITFGTCPIAMLAHENKFLNTEVFVMLADWPEDNPPRLGTGWEKDTKD
jgi:hypothetical protein